MNFLNKLFSGGSKDKKPNVDDSPTTRVTPPKTRSFLGEEEKQNIEQRIQEGRMEKKEAMMTDRLYGTDYMSQFRKARSERDKQNPLWKRDPIGAVLRPLWRGGGTAWTALEVGVKGREGKQEYVNSFLEQEDKITKGRERAQKEAEDIQTKATALSANVSKIQDIQEFARVQGEFDRARKNRLKVDNLPEVQKYLEQKSKQFGGWEGATKLYEQYVNDMSKLQREVAIADFRQSGRFNEGAFDTEEGANNFFENNLSDYFNKQFDKFESGEIDGTQYDQILQARKLLLNGLMGKLTPRVSKLTAEGFSETNDAVFNGILATPIKQYMEAFDDFAYNEVINATTPFNAAEFINKFSQQQDVQNIDRYVANVLAKSGKYSATQKWKSLWGEGKYWKAVPNIIKDFNRSIVASGTERKLENERGGFFQGMRPAKQIAQDLNSKQRETVWREMVARPFVNEGGVLNLIEGLPLLLLGVLGPGAIAASPGGAKLLSTMIGARNFNLLKSYASAPTFAGTVLRQAPTIAGSVVTGAPFNAFVNQFIDENEINRILDLGFDALAGFVGGSANVVDQLRYAVKAAGDDSIKIADELAKFGIVLDPKIATQSKAEAIINQYASLGRDIESKSQLAVQVLAGIRQKAENAPIEELERMRSVLASTLTRSTNLPRELQNVARSNLPELLAAKTTDEIRASIIKTTSGFDPAIIERLLDVKFAEGAAMKVFDKVGDNIVDILAKSGITLPVEQARTLGAIIAINPRGFKGKDIAEYLIKADGGTGAVVGAGATRAAVSATLTEAIPQIRVMGEEAKALLSQKDLTQSIIDASKRVISQSESFAKQQSKQEAAIRKLYDNRVRRISDLIRKSSTAEYGRPGILADTIRFLTDELKPTLGRKANDAAMKFMEIYPTTGILKNNQAENLYDAIIRKDAIAAKKIVDRVAPLVAKGQVDTIQPEKLENFLSKAVDTLYKGKKGKEKIAAEINDSISNFLNALEANEVLITRSDIGEGIDGFLSIIPSADGRKSVIGVSAKMYDDMQKILDSGLTLTKTQSQKLKTSMGIMLHELGHLAHKTMPNDEVAGLKKMLDNTIIDKASGQLSLDSVEQLLGPALYKTKSSKYVGLSDLLSNGKINIDEVFEEVVADLVESGFTDYIFSGGANKARAIDEVANIADPKIKRKIAATKTITDEVADAAATYADSIMKLAYDKSKKSMPFDKFMEVVESSISRGNPNYLSTLSDDIKDVVVFSIDPEKLKKAKKFEFNFDEFYDMAGDVAQELVSRPYYNTLKVGFPPSYPKLSDVVNDLSIAINKGDDSFILPAEYTSLRASTILGTYFNKKLQGKNTKAIKTFYNIVEKSQTEASTSAVAYAQRVVDMYDPKTGKIILNGEQGNIADIALAANKRISFGDATNVLDKSGGINYGVNVTMSKYLLLENPIEYEKLLVQSLNKVFEDMPTVVAKLGDDAGAVWMGAYNTAKQMFKQFPITDELIADMMHPFIYDAKRYANIAARNGLDQQAIAKQMFSRALENPVGKTVLNSGIPGLAEMKGAEKSLFTHQRTQASGLLTNKNAAQLDNVLGDVITGGYTDVPFTLSPEILDEINYKLFYSQLAGIDGSLNIIGHYGSLFNSVINPEKTANAVLFQFNNALKQAANNSNKLIKDINPEEARTALEAAIKNMEELSNKFVYNADDGKKYVDGLIADMKEQLLDSKKSFFDYARSKIIGEIISSGKYDLSENAAAMKMTDDALLNAKANRADIIKKKEEAAIELNTLQLDDVIFDEMLNVPSKDGLTKGQVAKKAEELKKNIQELKEVATELTEGKYDVSLLDRPPIVSALNEVLKGDRRNSPARLLANDDFAKAFNDAYKSVYKDLDSVIYYKINPLRSKGQKGLGDWSLYVKHNNPEFKGITGFLQRRKSPVPSGSYLTVAAEIAGDPEGETLLRRMIQARSTLQFNKKVGNTTERIGFNQFVGETSKKMRAAYEGLSETDAVKVWDRYVDGQISNTIDISDLNEKQIKLWNNIDQYFDTVKTYRNNGNLGDIPYAMIKGSSPIGKEQIINTMQGMWMHTNTEDLATLSKKYSNMFAGPNAAQVFNRKVLLGGAFDVPPADGPFRSYFSGFFSGKGKFRRHLQNLFILKSYNPFQAAKFGENFGANYITAKAMGARTLSMNADEINTVRKSLMPHLNFDFFKSGKLDELPVELGRGNMGKLVNVLNQGNVLMLADKASMPAIATSALELSFLPIVQKYGDDGVNIFLNKFAQYERYLNDLELTNYHFMKGKVPMFYINKRADFLVKSGQMPNRTASEISQSLMKEWYDLLDFYKADFEPVINSTRQYLNTFFVFDNIRELGIIPAIESKPYLYGLMKRATGKVGEYSTLFAKEMQKAGSPQQFLKNFLNGENGITKRLAGEVVLALKQAHAIDRLVGNELDRTDIVMTLMTPMVAFGMGIYGGVAQSLVDAGKALPEFGAGVAAQVFMRSLLRYVLGRFYVYETSILDDVIKPMATAREVETDRIETFFNAMFHTSFKTLFDRYTKEKAFGETFNLANPDSKTFLAKIFNQKTTAQKDFQNIVSNMFLEAQVRDEGLQRSIGLILNDTPFAGSLASLFMGNPNIAANDYIQKQMQQYVKNLGLYDISNPWVSKELLGGIFEAHRINDIIKRAGGKISGFDPEKMNFADLVASGAITAVSGMTNHPSYESYMQALLGKGGGEQFSLMQYRSTSEGLKNDFADMFNSMEEIYRYEGAIQGRGSKFIQFVSAIGGLGEKYTMGELADAYIKGRYNLLVEEATQGLSKQQKTAIKNLLQSERTEAMEILTRESELSELSKEIYGAIVKDQRDFQEHFLKENWDWMAKEKHAVLAMQMDFLNKDIGAPINVENKTKNPKSDFAKLQYLSFLDTHLFADGEAQSTLNKMNLAIMRQSENVSKLSQKIKQGESFEDYSKRVDASINKFALLMAEIDSFMRNESSREIAKAQVGLVVAPYFKAINDLGPNEMRKFIVALGEGDEEKGKQRLQQSVRYFTDSDGVSVEQAFELTTGISTKTGVGGKKPKTAKIKKNPGIEMMKAKNTINDTIAKMKAIGIDLPTPLRYENRKGIGVRSFEIDLSKYLKFARDYQRAGAAARDELVPMRTRDLPVKTSRVIGGRTPVRAVRNAKVYSRRIGL